MFYVMKSFFNYYFIIIMIIMIMIISSEVIKVEVIKKSPHVSVRQDLKR